MIEYDEETSILFRLYYYFSLSHDNQDIFSLEMWLDPSTHLAAFHLSANLLFLKFV